MYIKSIIYELVSICMAILSINFNNKFDLIWSDDFRLGVFMIILSFVFTMLFGVCISLLCISNKNKYSKTEIYTDAVIRIGLALVFIIWTIAMVKSQIKISSYILINFESIMRYGVIMVGVNIITGLHNLIKGRKISEIEKQN